MFELALPKYFSLYDTENSGVKELFLKYSGLAFTVTGAALMILSVNAQFTDILGEFPDSMITGFTGLLLFFTGTFLMAKANQDFMEKIIEKAGKILKLLS